MTTVLCPLSASPAPMAALEVVLPTPPFPDVMTITLATKLSALPLKEDLMNEALGLHKDPVQASGSIRSRPPSRKIWTGWPIRSEEHTSELQSLMRISYAVFCLKKKTTTNSLTTSNTQINDRQKNNHYTQT